MDNIGNYVGRKIVVNIVGNLVYIGTLKKLFDVDGEKGALIRVSEISNIHIWIPEEKIVSIEIIE